MLQAGRQLADGVIHAVIYLLTFRAGVDMLQQLLASLGQADDAITQSAQAHPPALVCGTISSQNTVKNEILVIRREHFICRAHKHAAGVCACVTSVGCFQTLERRNCRPDDFCD